MAKYRKKPVVIEAFQLPGVGEPPEPFLDWAQAQGLTNFFSDEDEGIVIPTREGDMRADPGDWVIKGIAGEFYPCKPDIFAMTYEPAEGERMEAEARQ